MIWFASVEALSWSKLPSMMASPPVMASLTVAVEMFESSSQMEMVPLLAASSVVAAAKADAPSELELQLDDPAFGLIVGGACGSHVDRPSGFLLTRGRRSLAEHHLGGGADLIDSGLRVEVRFIALPGKTHDDTIFVVVDVALVVGDAEADKAILDNVLAAAIWASVASTSSAGMNVTSTPPRISMPKRMSDAPLT